MAVPGPSGPQERSRGARAALRGLGRAALLLAATWLALSQVAVWQHPDHSDEPEWVAISILHWRQVVHGGPPAGAELDPPGLAHQGPWQRGVQRTVFGYMNPCLPKLVWGGALHATGHREASPLVFEVYHRADPAAGLAARAATEEAMPTARAVVLALASLSGVLLLYAARELLPGRSGWLVGLLALALYLASPLVRHTATYIRTDFFMLPFALGSLVLALRARAALAGQRGPGAQLLAAAALGLLGGLAVSSKLNGALVGVCVALWLPLLAWRMRADARPRVVPALAGVALAGGVTCLVFYALNPRLWSGPIAGVQDILSRWDRQLVVQTERAARMGAEPSEGLGESLSGFASRLAEFDAWRSLTGLPGGTALLAAGLALLAWRALRSPAQAGSVDARPVAGVTLVFVLVVLVGIGVVLPLHWGRFSLPTAPVTALLQALFLAQALLWAVGRLRRPVAPPPAGPDPTGAR